MSRITRNNEQGSSAVEFALVLPLLVMVVLGIVQFGLLYSAKLTLDHAVREGARAAILPDATIGDVKGHVADSGKAIDLKPGKVTAVACNEGNAGETVKIQAEHVVPMDMAIVKFGAITLQSTAALRCPGLLP